jgi:hypothetical protein
MTELEETVLWYYQINAKTKAKWAFGSLVRQVDISASPQASAAFLR